MKITMNDILDSIKETHFINVGSAIEGEHAESLNNMTMCYLVLKNGFVVKGYSACVDSNNYNEEYGKTLAKENAIQKIWPYLGYELATKLSQNKAVG